MEDILQFKFINQLLKENKKLNLFLVGGAVRDHFLGLESTDFDFIAEGVCEEELICLLKKYGRVSNISARTFGTLKFKPHLDSSCQIQDSSYDFSIPRRERYEPGKRRKDAHIELGKATLVEDLARRDFTINAMALDLRKQIESGVKSRESRVKDELKIKNSDLEIPQRNALVADPFNGLADIKDKLIRAVGDPYQRFTEDPTRILRGIRFAVKFDFQIEEKTLQAMQDLKTEITKKFTNEKGEEVERVSWEVIGQEFLKTLDANPRRWIELYDKVELLPILFPEIEAEKGVDQPHQFHSEGDVFVHTKLALENLPKDAPLLLKVATLLHDIGKPGTFTPVSVTKDRIRFNEHDNLGAEIASKMLRRLKLPNEFIDEVAWLIKNHMRVIFTFPRMRLEKKKNFARNELVPTLLDLVKADTLASIDQNGKTFIDSYNKIADELKKFRKEVISRPREIINGHEIIQIIKTLRPNFNSEINGKKIGAIKKNINTMYDRGEIHTKEEALEKVLKWARKRI